MLFVNQEICILGFYLLSRETLGLPCGRETVSEKVNMYRKSICFLSWRQYCTPTSLGALGKQHHYVYEQTSSPVTGASRATWTTQQLIFELEYRSAPLSGFRSSLTESGGYRCATNTISGDVAESVV